MHYKCTRALVIHFVVAKIMSFYIIMEVNAFKDEPFHAHRYRYADIFVPKMYFNL